MISSDETVAKRRPTSADRYYEAASAILEDEGPLAGNGDDNAHELGALISQWIERKRDNWEPS